MNKEYFIEVLDKINSVKFVKKQDVINEYNLKKELQKPIPLKTKFMKITEEQKQQLINLNDSKVNEILGVNTYNNWYKYKNTNFLMYIHDNGRYGFGADGLWLDNLNENKSLNKIEGYNLATAEEVEKALVNEAKRRGFGDRLEVWDFNGNYTIMSSKSGVIFEYGKWAESFNKQEIINQINELLKQL